MQYLYFVKEPTWQLEILLFMMKFRFFLLSFFFISVLTAFAEGNKDKTTADTLKIAPSGDTLSPGDSIMVAPADTNAVQTPVDSTIDSVERKGFLALWVMIAILILLVFMGYRYRHKDN
jgi:hypothetical protein